MKSLGYVASDGKSAMSKNIVNGTSLVGAARRDTVSRIHLIMSTLGISGVLKVCLLRAGGIPHALES